MPTFYFSRKGKLIADLKFIIRKTIKCGVKIFGVNLATLRKRIDTLLFVIKKVRSASPVITLKKLITSIYQRKIYTVYRLSINDLSFQDEQLESTIRINKYADLLKYNDASYWISKRDLLSNALKQFSSGASLYTIVKNETLAHFGWMISGNNKKFLNKTGLTFDPSVNGLVLNDFFTNPSYTQQEFFIDVLKNIVALSRSSDTEEIFILHAGNKDAWHNAIELTGFEEYDKLIRISILRTVKDKQFPKRRKNN
jgi:hypothetical protein